MKRLIALVITVVILIFLIRHIDFVEFVNAFKKPNWFDLGVAFFLFLPLIAITAFRWQLLVVKSCTCSFFESVKLLLSSNSLNLILPSKMGDLAKAVFLRNTGKVDMSRGFNIVIFEKLLDLSSLGVVFLFGYGVFFLSQEPLVGQTASYLNTIARADVVCSVFILFVLAVTFFIYFVPLKIIPGYSRGVQFLEKRKYLNRIGHFLEDGQLLIKHIRENNYQIILIILLSILLWFLHMTQVYYFFKAVGVDMTLITAYHWAPVAILIGLVPVTISGIGLRDGAFIYFLSPYANEALLFAGSVLVTLRYVIPGVLGLFFINQYMVRDKKSLEQGS